MKIFKLLFISAILINFSGYSQTNCDVLKKENVTLKNENTTLKDANVKALDENRFLKQKLEMFTVLNKPQDQSVTSFTDKFDFKIVSVKGNKVAQTVTINFLLTHQLPNQLVNIIGGFGGIGFDPIGNEIKYLKANLGNNTNNNIFEAKIFTDSPLKGFIVFGGVLPGIDVIKSGEVPVEYKNAAGGDWNKSKLTFSNLKIEW